MRGRAGGRWSDGNSGGRGGDARSSGTSGRRLAADEDGCWKSRLSADLVARGGDAGRRFDDDRCWGLRRTPTKTEGTSGAGLLLGGKMTDAGAGTRGAPLLEHSGDGDLARRRRGNTSSIHERGGASWAAWTRWPEGRRGMASGTMGGKAWGMCGVAALEESRGRGDRYVGINRGG